MEASPKLRPKAGAFAGSRLLAMQPDRIVCALALRGNNTAYETLYERYHGPVYGFAYHLLGRVATAEDAEDIAQETFSTAFSKLGDRRDDGSFKSWLFTIARNRTFDHLRVRRPQPADVTQLAIAGAADTERDAESNAQMTWLVTAMNELPPRQREALVMKELGGMSLAEIATGMETTTSGVKQLLNRARTSLGEAAEDSGFSRRRLRGDLNAAVPALPVVAGGGLAAFGIGGAATGGAATAGAIAGAGGVSTGVKAAAVFLTVAAIGGGTVGVRQAATGGERPAAGQSAENGGDNSGGQGSSPNSQSAPVAGDNGDSSGERSDRRNPDDGDSDARGGGSRDLSNDGDKPQRESNDDDGSGSDSEASSGSGEDSPGDEGSDSGEHESGSGESSGEPDGGRDEPEADDPEPEAEPSSAHADSEEDPPGPED